ncbi:uncharacterized protein Dvar_73480 [Desulfosarcina variabilis str. Montpellier]
MVNLVKHQDQAQYVFIFEWALRAREKITSHFQRPSIPLSGVAKTRNMPDIPLSSRLAERAPEH